MTDYYAKLDDKSWGLAEALAPIVQSYALLEPDVRQEFAKLLVEVEEAPSDLGTIEDWRRFIYRTLLWRGWQDPIIGKA